LSGLVSGKCVTRISGEVELFTINVKTCSFMLKIIIIIIIMIIRTFVTR